MINPAVIGSTVAVTVGSCCTCILLMSRKRMVISIVNADILSNKPIRVILVIPHRMCSIIPVEVIVYFLTECPHNGICGISCYPVTADFFKISLNTVRHLAVFLNTAEIIYKQLHGIGEEKLCVGMGKSVLCNDCKFFIIAVKTCHIPLSYTVSEIKFFVNGLTLNYGKALRNTLFTYCLHHFCSFSAEAPMGVTKIEEGGTVIIGKILFTLFCCNKAVLIDIKLTRIFRTADLTCFSVKSCVFFIGADGLKVPFSRKGTGKADFPGIPSVPEAGHDVKPAVRIQLKLNINVIEGISISLFTFKNKLIHKPRFGAECEIGVFNYVSVISFPGRRIYNCLGNIRFICLNKLIPCFCKAIYQLSHGLFKGFNYEGNGCFLAISSKCNSESRRKHGQHAQ